MPDLKLHKRNKDIYLFINPEDCTIEQLRDTPNEIETLAVDPNFTHFACATEWETTPIQIILDLDVFSDVFLKEETITNVKLRHPHHTTPGNHKTNYFQIESAVIESLSKALNNENVQLLSKEIFDKEQEHYEEGKESEFETKYNYPISFLPENVQQALRLKKNKGNRNDDSSDILNEKKPRLTPSHEIYERIMHDPNAEKEFFVIGYLDRFTGIKEVEFTKFVTLENERFYNTSIPFHRIRHFKYKGNVVWDRESRLDLITGNTYLDKAFN